MSGVRQATATLSSDREIVITRTFDAPCATVFEMWTKPEHVVHWWDPRGVPLAACEIDLRPNGAFRFVHDADGGDRPAFAGVYREIAAPTRLVFTTRTTPSGAEAIGTLLFTEEHGATTLTLTITCASRADRDAMLKMRIDHGTMRTLDSLDRYLGTIA